MSIFEDWEQTLEIDAMKKQKKWANQMKDVEWCGKNLNRGLTNTTYTDVNVRNNARNRHYQEGVFYFSFLSLTRLWLATFHM